MVKKITRKKALSLALAGLMLAPSLPIQSFAQGTNQGAKVESGTNKNVQSKQYIWGKYNVSKQSPENLNWETSDHLLLMETMEYIKALGK